MKPSQSNRYEELLKHILSKCPHRVHNIGAIRLLIQRHSIAVLVLMATIKNVAMWNISMWNLEYLRANAFTQQIDQTDCTEKVQFILLNEKLSYEIYREWLPGLLCAALSASRAFLWLGPQGTLMVLGGYKKTYMQWRTSLFVTFWMF